MALRFFQDKSKALFEAVKQGQHELLKELLAKGADANSRDETGASLLIRACLAPHHKVVKVILDARADANARDANGVTALMAACLGDQYTRLPECLCALATAANPSPENILADIELAIALIKQLKVSLSGMHPSVLALVKLLF